jgi:hypothetical protein
MNSFDMMRKVPAKAVEDTATEEGVLMRVMIMMNCADSLRRLDCSLFASGGRLSAEHWDALFRYRAVNE